MAEGHITIARIRADEPVARALLSEYIAGLRSLMPDFDPARSVSADPDEMAPPRGAFLVVIDGDTALGCGGIKAERADVAEIKRMYVRPVGRGRGLGRLLLTALEDEARALGMKRAVLDTVLPHAAAAVALYRAAGYVDVPAYNANPFANVWMAKDL